MLVTPRYLDRHKLAFESETELLALMPAKIRLSGFEAGGFTIVLDLPQDGKKPHAISILHIDDNPDDAEGWELDKTKRRTLVIPEGAKTGYMFDGLLGVAEARTWFRHRFGAEKAPEAAADPANN